MNTLAELSCKVRELPTPAVTLPLRRRVLTPVAPVPAHAAALRPRYMPPVQENAPQNEGPAQRIINGLFSKGGILHSDAKAIASYVGAAYLDRLAHSHRFTWWTSGDGVTLRYHANRAPTQRQLAAALRR